MRKTIGFILLLLGLAVIFLVLISLLAKQSAANTCKHENAECYWNHSENDCCAGLDCNYWKTTGGTRRFKCEVQPTPTNTPTPTPTEKPKCKESGRCEHDHECCSGDCHKGECKVVKPTPTPTQEPEPTPTPTEEPKGDGRPFEAVPPVVNNTTEAPQCHDVAPTKVGENFHIFRNGDTAIAKWIPTEGDKVQIYYKQNSSLDWQYALRDIPNNGYAVINGLGTMDITFALQESQGCAGGKLVNYVIDNSTTYWQLYR